MPRTAIAQRTAFEEAIREALELHPEADLPKPIVTAKEARRLSCDYAKATVEQVQAWADAIEKDNSRTMPAFIRGLTFHVTLIRDRRISYPTDRPEFVRTAFSSEALQQATWASIATPTQALAVVWEMAVQKHPDVFGRIDNLRDYQARQAQRQERYEDLLRRGDEAWTFEDVLADEPDRQNRLALTFKHAPGAVDAFPRHGSTQRLVERMRAEGRRL